MQNKKNIAVFAEYYPPHLGGLENYVYNVSEILKERGYSITVVTTRYNQELSNDEVINGIRILRYPVRNLFVSRYPIPKADNEYKEVIKKLEREKIDFVILNTRFFLSTSIGASFCKKNNIPNILIEHGCEHLTVDNKILDYFGSLYEHVLTKTVAKKVNAYYGVSEACNDWLKHFHLKSSGTLNGAVHINEKNNYTRNTSDNKTVFTYAGRLLKQKGVLELINTFDKLSKQDTSLELYIAGKGPLEGEILAFAEKNVQIHYLGYLSHHELMEQLSKTDVFVYVPVWPEGLGISVIEAGLMNCATIISDQKGIMEVVPNENYGYIVDEQHHLYECMEDCILHKEEREIKAKKLHERVLEIFSWNHTVDQIEEIIKNVGR